MDDSFLTDEEGSAGALPLVVAAVLILVAVGGGIDLALDRPTSWLSTHVIFEVGMMAVSLSFAGWLWRGWRRASQSLRAARRAFELRHATLQAERDQWRESAQAALAGLGVAIDQQFDGWKLTPSEREVALLILKGYGHKQIAGATQRSERTVRQHAVTVYQKSGLAGRAELAAFFLEDLLLPRNT
ncbi:MAG: LuxR C-terminal-related transcriptional regulator [Gemmatimonadaceae bacterium]|jgi:DNA-binding CsgD family transcriptional regulator